MQKTRKVCANCSRWEHPLKTSACYMGTETLNVDVVPFKTNGREFYCDDFKARYKAVKHG